MLQISQIRRASKYLLDITELSGELHTKAGSLGTLELFGMHQPYIPIHFSLPEFVPPETLSKWGEKAWWFVDARIAWTADAIWEYFNGEQFLGVYPLPAGRASRRVWINNYQWGGPRKYSGYRPPECTVGVDESQHRFCRAIDFVVEGIPAEFVREVILRKDRDISFQFITAMEVRVNWNHVDCRNTTKDKIILFTPDN